MLTVQKVFSALKAAQCSFLTSANKKIGKEDFGLKQLLLAKNFDLSESCFPLEGLSPRGRAGTWREQCIQHRCSHSSALPWQKMEFSGTPSP